ncbi:hypothetical protein CPZ32_07455 [Bacillus cereus]|nr:hypothetical protein CPZ32_07455 [Bacillus cereus]
MTPLEIYRRFFHYINHNFNYIGDFSNISTATSIISAIRHRISTARQTTTSLHLQNSIPPENHY